MRILLSVFSRRNRTSRRASALWAVIALLAALLIPAASATAAVSSPSAKAPVAKTTAQKAATQKAVSPKTAAKPTAPKPVDLAKPVPKPRTRPTPPNQATKTKVVSPSQAKQARSAAAKSAIAHATVPNTCSGAISPDAVYPCSTPSGTGSDTFTVSLSDTADVLVIQVLSTSGNELPFTLTAPGGATVSCVSSSYYGQIPQCATSAPGAYTVAVSNQGSNYTISYMPILSDTTCGALSSSFAAAPTQGTSASGAVGLCYTLDVATGHTVFTNMTYDAPYLETQLTIFDSTGAQICLDTGGMCALTGTGPYRVLVDNGSGTALSYGTSVGDVTAHTGCITTPQMAYGVAPDDSSSNECRELTVITAGQYQVYPATDWSLGGAQGVLYTSTNADACTNTGPFCQLSPGTYYYLEFEDPLAPYDFAMVFTAVNESRGCTATGDTDFATGPATAMFSGPGEIDCLNLPTASGQPVYLFDEALAPTALAAPLLVVDATGAQLCTDMYRTIGTCTPTGTAPFHVLLAAQQAKDIGYKLIVQATDSTAGCAFWPRSGFGGSWGATETTSATSNYVCLSVPASQHSVSEMVDYADITNTQDGGITFEGPTGAQVCQIIATGICYLKAGVNYTVILSNTGQNQTYDLVRRDVTQAATCSTPASTAVGGPSTAFYLNSPLDTTCYRVSAAAADDLWFDVRTLAPYPVRAIMWVTNSAGTVVCGGYVSKCQATGNTDYQVISDAYGYAGVTIKAQLDTWRVATASGPAAQCAQHQLSGNGWAPISGTLTESATAYCAAMPVQLDEMFDVYGMDSAPTQGDLSVQAYALSSWGSATANEICGGFGQCMANGVSGEAVLILSLYDLDSPISFTMQGVCSFECTGRPGPATLEAVSPASQPASAYNEVTVTGSDLNLGTQVMLYSNGTPVSYNSISQPVSINAAGTQLTVQLDTYGVTPGKYDVELDGSSTLSGAYTVTSPSIPANSAFFPLTPSRVLDTRIGLGAPKARVAAHGTVALKVAGVGGVPATGTTAVAVDLTSVSPAASGDLVAYADGTSVPGTSSVHFSAGANATNLAIIPVTDGKIDLYNASGGAVDLLADVDGYYSNTSTAGGSLLTTVTPAQLFDSGGGSLIGQPKQIPAGSTLGISVLGSDTVPTTSVKAVVLGVNTLAPTASGSLTAYADGSARPAVTDASFTAGQSGSNVVVVPVTDGRVDFYNSSAAPLGVIISIEGYYSASGSGFQPLAPERVLDTRTGLGGSGLSVVPGGIAKAQIFGERGIPYTATAVVLNITVTGAQNAGQLTAYADGNPVPPVWNVGFAAGQTVSDTVVVPLYEAVDFLNSSVGDVQVIADIEGYYTT